MKRKAQITINNNFIPIARELEVMNTNFTCNFECNFIECQLTEDNLNRLKNNGIEVRFLELSEEKLSELFDKALELAKENDIIPLSTDVYADWEDIDIYGDTFIQHSVFDSAERVEYDFNLFGHEAYPTNLSSMNDNVAKEKILRDIIEYYNRTSQS